MLLFCFRIIPFVALQMLPGSIHNSVARTVKVSTGPSNFLWFVVLPLAFWQQTLYLFPGDFGICLQEILAFAAFPADFGICPHLPARLRLSYRFLCSGQHTYSNNSDKLENAVIVVTLPAGVEMLSSLHQRSMFGDEIGVRDGAPLMDRTHPCLVALAAASHWPPHMRMCSTCFKYGSDPGVIFALNKQPTQYWNAWR